MKHIVIECLKCEWHMVEMADFLHCIGVSSHRQYEDNKMFKINRFEEHNKKKCNTLHSIST